MKFYLTLAAGLVAAAPLFAESHGNAEGEAAEAAEATEAAVEELVVTGDVAAGEKAFKKCISCHVVKNGDEVLAGKKAKTGPNLYGVAGGVFGQAEGFKYGKGATAVADMNITFTEAEFAAYVADPSGWLTEKAGENTKSKMTYKVKKEEDAINLFAFLHSLQQ